MNFVQGGGCDATGGRCLLGFRGSSARNSDRECELHGKFDVWVMQDNNLLISDMGFPSAEPRQSLALGVDQDLAKSVAKDKSRQLRTNVITSQRRCFQCAKLFWISEHYDSSNLASIERGYLCPLCIRHKISNFTAKKLGLLSYWCG